MISKEQVLNKKWLFIDLDDTLIETVSGSTFPTGIWDMKFKEDCLDAIKAMKPEGVFIVTNQGGIDKGYVKHQSFHAKGEYIMQALIDYIDNPHVCMAVCESNDKTDQRRKPNTGMFDEIYLKFGTREDDSLMVGDASGFEGQFSDSDKKFAENVGMDYLDVNEFINLMLKS